MSLSSHPAITTGPSNGSNPKSGPSHGANPEKTPEIERLQREQTRLEQRSKQVSKKLKQVQHGPEAQKLGVPQPSKLAAEPTSNDLTEAISQLLRDLQINGKVETKQTQLINQMMAGGENWGLFSVQLRREVELTDNEINRLKRKSDNFETLYWTAKGIIIELWYPYEKPAEQTGKVVKPGIPGVAGRRPTTASIVRRIAEFYAGIRTGSYE